MCTITIHYHHTSVTTMSGDYIPVPPTMYAKWLKSLTAMAGSVHLEQKAEILGMVTEMKIIQDEATGTDTAVTKPLPMHSPCIGDEDVDATEVTAAKKRAPQGYNYWCIKTNAKKDKESMALFLSLSDIEKKPFMDGQKEKNKEEKRKKEEKKGESSEESNKKKKVEVESDVQEL